MPYEELYDKCGDVQLMTHEDGDNVMIEHADG